MADTPHFTEKEPYEKGFAEVFAQRIAPRLEDLETERLGIFGKQQKRKVITIAVVVALAILAAVLSLMTWGHIPTKILIGVVFLFFALAFIAGVIGFTSMSKMAADHVESLRGIVVAPVCAFIGDLEYLREPGERFDNKRFVKLGIVPSGSWGRFEDLFTGRYRDTGFKMVEGQVIRRSKDSTYTVFDGLLFEIDVPLAFGGRVIIGRDKGRISNALKGFFKDKFGKETRIQFPDPAFEERYAVYASDADEAMTLVSPGFCKNMLALADAYSEKSLGAAFVDGVFLLAVPVPGNLFEPGSIEQSVYDCEDDIHDFLREITIAHRVIEFLHGERPSETA